MASRMDDRTIELALTDLGGRLAYPSVDLWPAVRERIVAGRRPWWRSLSGGLRLPAPVMPIVATLVVILLVVLAVSPEARAKAAELLGLRGVQIIKVPETPTPTPSPTGTPLVPGGRVTLEEARAQAGFTVRVPAALGDPDEVTLEPVAGGARVTLVYRDRPDIPPSSQPGISALVVELGGRLDQNVMGKGIGPGTTLEQLTVNGGLGFWIAGQPHQVFYLDQRGQFQQETLRLAGNTLLWEQDGVTYRIEAQITKDAALRVAASFR